MYQLFHEDSNFYYFIPYLAMILEYYLQWPPRFFLKLPRFNLPRFVFRCTQSYLNFQLNLCETKLCWCIGIDWTDRFNGGLRIWIIPSRKIGSIFLEGNMVFNLNWYLSFRQGIIQVMYPLDSSTSYHKAEVENLHEDIHKGIHGPELCLRTWARPFIILHPLIIYCTCI